MTKYWRCRRGPDRIGLLEKPPAAQHSFPIHVPHNSMPEWSNMSVVVHNLYCVWVTIMGKLACRNLKGATKYWRRQKCLCQQKILTSTKCWGRQDIRIDRMLASTNFLLRQKIWHRQKSSIDKMLAHAQEHLLTVWRGRVHSSWLLPNLADDLLHLPEGDCAAHAIFCCKVNRSLFGICCIWRLGTCSWDNNTRECTECALSTGCLWT